MFEIVMGIDDFLIQLVKYCTCSLKISVLSSKKKSLKGIMKSRIEQFPVMNPNPVLSVAKDGTVLYSNVAGEPLLHE